MTDLDDLITGLRIGTSGSDPHVRAAVGLLVSQGREWLRNRAFVTACVRGSVVEAWIAWDKAREFERGPGAAASSSQRAVLRVAIALGSDEFRLSRMDDRQAKAIVEAFADALAVEVILGG